MNVETNDKEEITMPNIITSAVNAVDIFGNLIAVGGKFNKIYLFDTDLTKFDSLSKNICSIDVQNIEVGWVSIQNKDSIFIYFKTKANQFNNQYFTKAGCVTSNNFSYFTNLKIELAVIAEDHQTLFFQNQDKKLILFNLTTDTEIKALDFSEQTSCITIAVSFNGSFMACGLASGKIILWEKLSSTPPVTIYSYNNASIKQLEFSEDENYLASSNEEGILEIWDTKSKNLYRIYANIYNNSPLKFLKFNRAFSSSQCNAKLSECVYILGNFQTFPNCVKCTTLSCSICQTGFFLTPIINTDQVTPLNPSLNNALPLKCTNNSTGEYFFDNNNQKIVLSRNICTLLYPNCNMCSSFYADCTKCSAGYYLSQKGNLLPFTGKSECKKCPDKCVECSSDSICTKCAPPKVLDNDICQNVCSSGKYPINSQCEVCDANCAECESKSKCKQCSDECFDCPSNCATCSTEMNCISCNTGYLFDSGICKQSCPNGNYLEGGVCTACGDNCESCTNKANCIACVSNYFTLKSGLCGLCSKSFANCETCTEQNCNKCQSKYFMNNENLCAGCFANCIECSKSTSCSKCSSGYFLVPGSDEDFTSCEKPCPSKEYRLKSKSTQTSDGTAKCEYCAVGYVFDQDSSECKLPCNIANCQKCADPPTSCQFCNSPYLIGPDKNCISQCPTTYYNNNQNCSKCHNNCLSCFGPNPNNCISCLSDAYLLNNECNLCSSKFSTNCETCNSSHCLKCKTDYFLHSENSECKICCDITYFQKDAFSCSKCSENCLNCLNEADCLGCNPGFFLQKLLGKGICKKCEIAHCNLCNSKESCLKCEAGYFLASLSTLVVSNQVYDSCVKACDENERLKKDSSKLNDGSGRCEYCRENEIYNLGSAACEIKTVCNLPNCKKCLNTTHCSQCEKDFLKETLSSSCITECPPKYTKIDSDCIPCGVGCAECSKNSETKTSFCNKCEQTYLLLKSNQSCIKNCEDSQYFLITDAAGGSCESCHTSCRRCFGPDEAECSDCPENYILKGTYCKKQCEKEENCTGRTSSVEVNLIESSESLYLSFSKEIKAHSNLNLSKMFDVSVVNVSSSNYEYSLEKVPDDNSLLKLNLNFKASVSSPQISVAMSNISASYLKDENQFSLTVDNTTSVTNITYKSVYVSQSLPSNNETSSYISSLLSLGSIIVFGNGFSYFFNMERFSSMWIMMDSMQSISLMLLMETTLSKSLEEFLVSTYFFHADFIIFAGKSMNSSKLYYFGSPVNQKVYNNNFFRFLGTSGFMMNASIAFMIIILLHIIIIGAKIIIIYLDRKGEYDSSLYNNANLVILLLSNWVIRISTFFLPIIVLSACLQLKYYGNPSGQGGFLAVLALAYFSGFILYFAICIVNNSNFLADNDPCLKYDPLFANISIDSIWTRNHYIFVLIRKLLFSVIVVALAKSPNHGFILLFVIYFVSVLKNVLKNPFLDSKLRLVTLASEILVTITIIVFLLLSQNHTSMIAGGLIIDEEAVNLQSNYGRVVIGLVFLNLAIFLCIAVVLFCIYFMQHMDCLCSLINGMGLMGYDNVQKEEEDSNSNRAIENKKIVVELTPAK